MSPRIVSVSRSCILAAASAVLACIPFLWLAERIGWNQRPIRLMQNFLLVPVACIASAAYLFSGQAETRTRGMRTFACVVCFGSALWLAFLVYVRFFADFSWMDQR